MTFTTAPALPRDAAEAHVTPPPDEMPTEIVPSPHRARAPAALAPALALAALSALPLAAQDPPSADTSSPAAEPSPQSQGAALPAGPPPSFEALETARSRACVPALARLEAVTSELEPRRSRAERIRALHEAVTMEDSLRVGPLDGDDPLERRVGEWFGADRELALRYLDTEDEEVRERRLAQRREMLSHLEEAFEEVNREARRIVESEQGLEEALSRCRDRILVRSAVLDACRDADGAVCEAARAEEPPEGFRFAERAADLWDVEQLRPWSEASRLQPGPGGGLGGARTTSLARRGNVALVVSLQPLIQRRSALAGEEAAEFDAHLDSLGFEFDHPDFVMAPALRFELDVPGVLGDETHYVLHFGDLSDPERDVVRTIPVPEAWPVAASFTASEATLVRLAQGEPLALTAVHRPEQGDAAEGEAVYSLGLTPIGQARAVTALLRYMGNGNLASDLAALVAPEGSGEDGGTADQDPGDPGR